MLATRDPAPLRAAAIAPLLEFGASPRASLGLVAAARALALLRGRDYVLPQDVYDVAIDVLPHRLVLSFDAVADGDRPARTSSAALLAAVHRPSRSVAPQQDPRPDGPATAGAAVTAPA